MWAKGTIDAAEGPHRCRKMAPSMQLKTVALRRSYGVSKYIVANIAMTYNLELNQIGFSLHQDQDISVKYGTCSCFK